MMGGWAKQKEIDRDIIMVVKSHVKSVVSKARRACGHVCTRTSAPLCKHSRPKLNLKLKRSNSNKTERLENI